jgi:hypothetical protein
MADILEAKRPTIAQCKAEIIILRNRNSELNTTLHSAKITSEQLHMSNRSYECRIRNLEEDINRLRNRNADLGKLGMKDAKRLYTTVGIVGFAFILGFVLGILIKL